MGTDDPTIRLEGTQISATLSFGLLVQKCAPGKDLQGNDLVDGGTAWLAHLIDSSGEPVFATEIRVPAACGEISNEVVMQMAHTEIAEAIADGLRVAMEPQAMAAAVRVLDHLSLGIDPEPATEPELPGSGT